MSLRRRLQTGKAEGLPAKSLFPSFSAGNCSEFPLGDTPSARLEKKRRLPENPKGVSDFEQEEGSSEAWFRFLERF